MNFSQEEINCIRKNIKMIQQFMTIPEIESIRLNDSDAYKEKLKSIFTSFEFNYPSLFNLIISKEDLSPLDFMLSTMEEIVKGDKEKDKGEMEIGDHLAQKYVKIDPNKLFKKK
jgi:hypothetical protein